MKFKNGKVNGKWVQWFSNGNKELSLNYVNGVPRGRAKFWFEDGTLRAEGIVKSEVVGGGWILEDSGGNKRVFK